MAMLKEQNDSEKALTVGSLKVIGDISNSGVQILKQEVSSLKTIQQTATEKQNQYWSELSDDAIITPSEKITLKKEFQTISQTYSAIVTDLETSIAQTDEIINYKTAYQTLYNYLYSVISVFEDMTVNTTIPDTQAFNDLFSDYYYKQTLAQNRITIGLVERYGQGLRTLSSLDEIGLEGEVAVYNSGFYQYDSTNEEWVLINTASTYLGALDEVPEGASTGSFFLLKSDAVYYRKLKDSANNYIKTGDDKYLIATKKLTAKCVYYHSDGIWKQVTDSNDWRCMVALGDILQYGGTVPSNLAQYVTDEQDDYWSEMSSDDCITAIEKKTLYKQWLGIQSTYTMISTKLASDTDMLNDLQTSDPALYNYFLSYFTLNNHIATGVAGSLELFKDMESPFYFSEFSYTDEDGNVFTYTQSDFNSWFTNYYDNEVYAKATYASQVAKTEIHSKVTTYLGVIYEVPTEIDYNDTFVWGTTTKSAEDLGVTISTGYFKLGYLYKYVNDDNYDYLEVSSTEKDSVGNLVNSKYFMTALTDILKVNSAGNGYFDTVFCDALLANAAFITNLQTKTITLEDGGNIQSNKYTNGSSGFCINYEGTADFNGSTHIGGTCTIDGTTTIGGTCTIGSNANAQILLKDGSASFTGEITAKNITFSGVGPGSYQLSSLTTTDGEDNSIFEVYFPGTYRVYYTYTNTMSSTAYSGKIYKKSNGTNTKCLEVSSGSGTKTGYVDITCNTGDSIFPITGDDPSSGTHTMTISICSDITSGSLLATLASWGAKIYG